MRINGMGNVTKEEIKTVLTRDAIESIKSGDLTWEGAGEMYKLEKVRKLSKIGSMGDTFRANYRRIPDAISDKLSPADIAALVDAFYNCYSDGKNA